VARLAGEAQKQKRHEQESYRVSDSLMDQLH
jgi:hypothetical protein